jgi:hypothetical protein
MQVLPDDLTIGGDVADYPTTLLKPDASRWLCDEKGNFAKAEGPVLADANGWLYTTSDAAKWSWPVANEEPVIGSADYLLAHPTRYEWRDDVEKIARRLVDTYSVSCNTYYQHPPGWNRDDTSIDVWGPAGRATLDLAIGNQVHELIFNDPNPPDIDWIIWQGSMDEVGRLAGVPDGPLTLIQATTTIFTSATPRVKGFAPKPLLNKSPRSAPEV